ncbi:unnamed protein product [Cunninghamella blakesleeana]
MDIDNNKIASTPDTTQLHNDSQPQNITIKQEPLSSQPPEDALKAAVAERQARLPEVDKREKTLAEFLTKMDNYSPIIPDAVTDYYLNCAGFDCDDVRVKRLLALAAQKFVADIATDAFQYCKVRQSGNRSKVGKVNGKGYNCLYMYICIFVYLNKMADILDDDNYYG